MTENENKTWRNRMKFVIGFVIPAIPAAAVLIYVDRQIAWDPVQIPLWADVTITAASLLLAIAITAWAVRGGIPPKY